jgi:phosphate:Na+ symporter
MMTPLVVAGGVALLLFGVRYLRKGLDRLFGRRLEMWLHRAGSGRVRAFLTGLGVAAAAPSSTTISLLAVQSVQAGHMNARQMLAVMLGANIGLTVMVQVVALDLDMVAPVLILVGVVLFQYTRGTRSRGIGQVLLSLGLIFLALGIIKQTVRHALEAQADFQQVLDLAGHYPTGIAVIAAILTIAMQSSTATIGLIIGLIAADAVGLGVAIPAVFGANVGLALTTLVIGWREVESRRLALGNLSLKVLVAVLGLLALQPLLLPILEWLNWPMQTTVAMTHTGFNIVLALIGLPMVASIVAMLRRIVPEPLRRGDAFGPRYITASIEGTSLAMGQSLKEIMRVSEIARSMLDDAWAALKSDNEQLARDAARRDDQVDLLDAEIKKFLTRLVTDETDHRDADEQMRQLRYLSQLEMIGDIVDKNICELVLKKIRLGAAFSAEGASELDDFQRRVAENLLIAETAFTTRDPKLAEQLLRNKERLNWREQELRDRHFSRLTAGLQPSHETSAIHLDLLAHLRRINSAAAHVAYAIMEEPRSGDRWADEAE